MKGPRHIGQSGPNELPSGGYMDEQNERLIPMIDPSLRRPGFGMPMEQEESPASPQGSPTDPTPDMLESDRQPDGIEPWLRTNHGGGGPR